MDETRVISTPGGRVVGGRYLVRDSLAHGGMSEVVVAWDERLRRRVALKLLAPAIASDPVAARRFHQEAMAVAGLDHPGIVRVYDHGDDGTPYIVMELVEGETLKDLIQRRAPLPEDEVVAVARQVLDALGHAHAAGIVHRDVKPQNLLVRADGAVKLTDFGIARSAAATAGLTKAGQVLGTAAYMSPEQAIGRPAGPASDLYSLGAVLYEMLSGSPPFAGDSALAIARQHADHPPPPLRNRRPGLSRSVEAAVMRALAKDPGARHGSAVAMAAALGGEELATTRILPAVSRPAARSSRRLALALSLLALLAIGAILSAGLGGEQRAASRPDQPRSSQPARVTVPDIIGLPYTRARLQLERLGLRVARSDGGHSTAPAGSVVASSPPPGSRLARGSTVTLTVSSGPAPAPKPHGKGHGHHEKRGKDD